MRIKLDENLGRRVQNEFRSFGHDVTTVREQDLCGVSDHDLFRICSDESRCLLTLDLDFADVLRFPPHLSAGIAVIRLPKPHSLDLLQHMANDLAAAMDRESIQGRLWIVEPNRIRIHEPTETNQ